MSEIRSRDVNAPIDGGRGTLSRGYTGKAYRAVEWPEGAPPRSEVPHAGEKVMWAGIAVRVVSGVPHANYTGVWTLHVRNAATGTTHLPAILSLKPIPDEPETVTVDKAELRALRERLDELENQ